MSLDAYLATPEPDMSTALAIAGVTAVLRDLLNDGLVNHNVSGVLGSSVTVSVLAPDRVVPANGTEASQINLFLYLVTPNPGWRNDRPAVARCVRPAAPRQRAARARPALPAVGLQRRRPACRDPARLRDAAAARDAGADARRDPHRAQSVARTSAPRLPPALRALVDSGLEDQVELIKLTPQYLNTEEMSKLWTAMQSHFRPTAAYTASVVLIEATAARAFAAAGAEPRAGRSGDAAATAASSSIPGLVPPVPMLTAVVPPARQPVARIGDTIDLQGHDLDGTNREVRLVNDRFDIDATIPALPPPADRRRRAGAVHARRVACGDAAGRRLPRYARASCGPARPTRARPTA